MRLAVCLHGAAAARSSLRLHATDRRAIALARATGATVVAVEAVGAKGSAPIAVGEALGAGASRAVRIVEPAMADFDAGSTGFVLAAALDHLDVDLVLFGSDADPEGLADVPASIALHMAALYVSDVVNLEAVQDTRGTKSTASIVVKIRSGAWIRRLRLPANAVVGVAPGPDPSLPPSDLAPAADPVEVEVMSLGDLKIDPGFARRRSDVRDVIQSAPRPLITLHTAAAVAALLRRT